MLAPNLTIYNKLITDFTPNTAKYVFEGIAEFATNPPELITGDNYESGRGVRSELAIGKSGDLFDTSPIHVNIFNISKINSEVRGDKAPRIKRLSEYIGQSNFDYLAGLHDLVLLMDESHRYRASAGVKAINELKPIIGLELTATPQVESGGKPKHLVQVFTPLHIRAGKRWGTQRLKLLGKRLADPHTVSLARLRAIPTNERAVLQQGTTFRLRDPVLLGVFF